MVLLKEAQHDPDAALLEECRAGDSAAFDTLIRRYKDRIYRAVYRYAGNREDALDLCQEVFIRAYRGIKGFEGNAKVYTWLYAIAANVCKNSLRDSHRKGRDKGTSLEALQAAAPAVAAEASIHSRTPSDDAMSEELQTLLQQCLDELPDQYRMTFVLRTFEDMSYEEIADVMECPTGTVKSRLNQARRLLRDRLKELGAV